MQAAARITTNAGEINKNITGKERLLSMPVLLFIFIKFRAFAFHFTAGTATAAFPLEAVANGFYNNIERKNYQQNTKNNYSIFH